MYNGVYTIEQYAYVHDTLIKWLADKVQGICLGDKLNSRGIKKVAVYGANSFGEMVLDDIRNSTYDEPETVCFIDRNPDLVGKNKKGLRIIAPEDAINLDADVMILVTPEYFFREIMDNLIQIGIPMERIVSLAMIV